MDESEVSMSEKPISSIFFSLIVEESSSTESYDSLLDFIEPEPEDGPKMKLFKEGLYSPGSGEICAKYIAMSDSSVFRHPYFDYPAIIDPGIEKALLLPEPVKEYADDGQELYMDLCKEMNLMPVRLFYRGLITDTINLRYYGINPKGMKAMCLALQRNNTVNRFDLTGNYLDHFDATYHLGQMFGYKNALKELVLNQCYIGAKYMRRALKLLSLANLDLLDLSENNIRDEGFPFLTDQIFHGAVIRKLYLSRNKLTSDSLALLAEVIEFHDDTTHLDVSWNNFYKPEGVIQLIRVLRHSKVLVELDFSFTGLNVGIQIGALLRIETLKMLNLSHNRLTKKAARIIAKNLVLAKSLHTIDLSCNPFTPHEALQILLSLENYQVKLKELLMDFIEVNKDFAQRVEDIRTLSFRQDTVITHGHIIGNYTLSKQDLKVIVLQQLVRMTKKKPKKGVPMGIDIIVHILDIHKEGRTQIEIVEFMRTMQRAGAPVDDNFMIQLSKCFPGPKTETKIRPLNVEKLVEYIHRLYPEKQPTPTPPSTIDLPRKKKKKRGKKKK